MNEYLQQMYNNEDSFPDVILEYTNKKRVFCHKNILSACSPVLKAMFTTKMEEESQKTIKIDEDPTSMDFLIREMYTIELSFTLKNVQSIYAICHKYEVELLKKKCERFILNNVNTSNCVEYFNFSKTYDWNELTEYCLELMLKNFEVSQNWQELVFKDLKYLMGFDLFVDEIILFNKITQWLLFDFKKREIHMKDLLEFVDFSKLSIESIAFLGKNENILQNNPQFNSFILLKIQQKIASELVPLKKIKPIFGICFGSSVGSEVQKTDKSIKNGGTITKQHWDRGIVKCRFKVNIEENCSIFFGVINYLSLGQRSFEHKKCVGILEHNKYVCSYCCGKIVYQGHNITFQNRDIIECTLNFDESILTIKNMTSQVSYHTVIMKDDYAFMVDIYGKGTITILDEN
jgi:predicted CopG family antitoxin